MKRGALVLVLVLAACQRAPTVDRAPPGEVWIAARRAEEAGITTERVGAREVGEVLTSAKLDFHDQRVGYVYSPFNGRILSVSARLGQRVKRGGPLADVEAVGVERGAVARSGLGRGGRFVLQAPI